MAQFSFMLNKRHADAIVYGGKRTDIRPKTKHVGLGDIVQYTVVDDMRTLICHPIADKTYRVRYIEDYDPRIFKGYELIELDEIVSEWGD